MQSNSAARTTSGFPSSVTTKYIVLKSSNGAQQPVVTKVVKAPVSTPSINSISLKTSAKNSDVAVSTRSNTIAKKAYEKLGADDFLKRVTGGSTRSKQIVTATSSTALAGGVLSGSDHNGSNKKPSPPKQINIFSALEDDVVQSKKASPGVAGKKMSTRIEMSCTYQPPKSASKTIFSGVKTSDEITKSAPLTNSPQSLLEKLSNKDDWLLEFSGSPNRSPSKPGGSAADLNSSDEEDSASRSKRNNRVKEKTTEVTNRAGFSTKNEQDEANLDSSIEEIKRDVYDGDVEVLEEEDGNELKESRKTRATKEDKDKGLSFVEARTRRKRKPPTYFGYEDHELSYNLGLNPVFTQEELDAQAAAKKKRSASQSNDNLSTASSNSSGSRRRRKDPRSRNKGRDTTATEALAEDLSDSDDEEDNRSLSSSFSSLRSLKATEKAFELSPVDSSDEEPLNSVVQKEKARPENSAFKSEVEDMSSSPTKGGEASEVEQTAFRLYYKEHSSAVESIHKDGDHSEKKKTPTSQEISERVNNMWCGLGPDEREKYLKQARELTQIKLPPQLIKKKPLLNSAYSSGATSQITADQTKGDVGHKKSKFESKKKCSKDKDQSVLSKLAADLDDTSDSSDVEEDHFEEEDTRDEEDSPVKLSTKRKLNRVKIESTSSSEAETSSSSAGSQTSSDSQLEQRLKVKSKKHQDKSKWKKHRSEKNKSPQKQAAQPPSPPKICFNCPKQAVKSNLWCSDGQYCSISCCVLYSKKCFNDWVAERKRKADLKREEKEIEALKHAKDFFCIETEADDEDSGEQQESVVASDECTQEAPPPFSSGPVKLE